MIDMNKTVVELFAGVGGFRVGLNKIKCFDSNGKAIENKNWKFVWANQWEPSTNKQDAYECYRKRFGDDEISNIDIAKVDKEKIPNHTLLVGGFPCQDYSVARSLSGEKGIEGKKGVLFWEIAKILKTKKPPFILLENVDRLLKSPAAQRGRDFGIMLRTFHDYGYNVEWRVLNAAEYGRAQKRRRVYIFAWARDTNYQKNIANKKVRNKAVSYILKNGIFAKTFAVKEEPAKQIKKNIIYLGKNHYKDTVKMSEGFSANFENSGVLFNGIVTTIKTHSISHTEQMTLRDIIDKESDLGKYYLTEKQIEQFKILRGSKKKERIKPNGEKYIYAEGSMSPYDDLDSPGRTMLTSESSVNRSTHIIIDENNNKLRFITPIEAERLQDFPDNWTNTGMSEKRRYFMMGNALVTGLVSLIGDVLSEIISKEEETKDEN